MEKISFDLAQQTLRELNQYLHHDLAKNSVKQVDVLNPEGTHNIAVGVDAPVKIDIHGHGGQTACCG